MSNIECRLTALADALERRQMLQEMPVDGFYFNTRRILVFRDILSKSSQVW